MVDLKAWIEIIRPVNAIMSSAAVYIASLVSGSTIFPEITLQVILLMIAVFVISGAGMVINDIAIRSDSY